MPDSFRIGEFRVEPALYRVSGPAGTVRLEPKVMQVLLCVTEHRGDVVSKDRLMRAVWPDTFVTDDVLTRAISELRRVFGDDVKHPRVIETIPKAGYRLMLPVRFSNDTDAGAVSAQSAPTDTAEAVHDAFEAPPEAFLPRGRSRVTRWPWKRIVTMAAIGVGVLLVGAIGQRMVASPSPRVVRSVQLTFTADVAGPGWESDIFPALATDGARVYFTRAIAGSGFTLAQAAIGGGRSPP